jgi:hypothetical protein
MLPLCVVTRIEMFIIQQMRLLKNHKTRLVCGSNVKRFIYANEEWKLFKSFKWVINIVRMINWFNRSKLKVDS